MEYDISLAEAAYALAGLWDQSRDTSISQLGFKEKDLEGFNSNQKSKSV
jgi:leukotriene-A4 hydrolase